MSVSVGSLDDAKRTDIIERVTRLLAEVDDDGQRLFREPLARVQLVEVADGNWGATGQIKRLGDVDRFATQPAAVS